MKLFVFLKRPAEISTSHSVTEKLQTVILCLISWLMFTLLIAFIRYLTGIKTEGLLHDRIGKSDQLSIPAYYYYLGSIYSAVFEEYCFRLSLRFNEKYISVSLALLFLLVLKIVGRFVVAIWTGYLMIDLAIDAIIVLLLYLVIHSYVKDRESKIAIRYVRYYGVIFYSSILMFAFTHLFNYNIESFSVAFPSILVLISYFIFYGLIFSYVRLKNGIVWAASFHILISIITNIGRF